MRINPLIIDLPEHPRLLYDELYQNDCMHA